MASDASRLGCAHARFPPTRSPVPKKKRAFMGHKWSPSCCTDRAVKTAQKKRAWYNPETRKSSLFFRRRWVEADATTDVFCPLDSGGRFIVVSYNILGDDNASKHTDLYSHVPSHFMKWERRKRLICKELTGWNPDIVCLQEVDRYDDLLDNMKCEGFTGSFKRRTGESMDGCAIFWKENLLCLLEGQSIEFNRFGLRDNVAQLFVFEMNKDDSRRLLVGNIHVLFNPSRGDIKLGQIRLLLGKACELSEKWGGLPIVLAGDFNSTPQSAIYGFLSTSELNLAVHDRRNLSGQNWCHPAQLIGLPRQIRKPYSLRDRIIKYFWTDEEVKFASGSSRCTKLKHTLELNSSYASVKGNARTRGPRGEPLATTYHSNFLGTVDYLWYSAGLLPTRVLDTLPIDILRRTGLPSEKIGSDHLALVSEFTFTRCKAEIQANNGEEEEYNTIVTTSATIETTTTQEENDMVKVAD